MTDVTAHAFREAGAWFRDAATRFDAAIAGSGIDADLARRSAKDFHRTAALLLAAAEQREQWDEARVERDGVLALLSISQQQVAMLTTEHGARRNQFSQTGKMVTWQPIATAPTNGLPFLAVSPSGHIFIGHWWNGVVDNSAWDDEDNGTCDIGCPAGPARGDIWR
jgi:hypothetical protein